MNMQNRDWDRLIADLANHEEVAAVEVDGDDLVMRVRGGAIRISADRDHGRTVIWAPVSQVPNEAVEDVSAVAQDYNMEYCANSITRMGLFAQKHMLLIGKSIENEEAIPGRIVEEALELLDMLAAARSFVEASLAKKVSRDEAGADVEDVAGAPMMRA